MRIGMISAALGSIQQEKTLDVTANNIANAATPGFKKNGVQFKNYMSQMTHIRMNQGRLRPTENPMDIALDGEGFLRVQTDQGVLYTRAGNLTVNKQGQLATQEGWPVLGQGGPIQVEGIADLRIERGGQVFDGKDQIDTLNLARFGPETKLTKAQNGYFKANDGEPASVEPEKCSVLQGSLEEANFSIIEEMVHMIETMRIYEAYQKTQKIFDQMDSQLTSKLGNL